MFLEWYIYLVEADLCYLFNLTQWGEVKEDIVVGSGVLLDGGKKSFRMRPFSDM